MTRVSTRLNWFIDELRNSDLLLYVTGGCAFLAFVSLFRPWCSGTWIWMDDYGSSDCFAIKFVSGPPIIVVAVFLTLLIGFQLRAGDRHHQLPRLGLLAGLLVALIQPGLLLWRLFAASVENHIDIHIQPMLWLYMLAIGVACLCAALSIDWQRLVKKANWGSPDYPCAMLVAATAIVAIPLIYYTGIPDFIERFLGFYRILFGVIFLSLMIRVFWHRTVESRWVLGFAWTSALFPIAWVFYLALDSASLRSLDGEFAIEVLGIFWWIGAWFMAILVVAGLPVQEDFDYLYGVSEWWLDQETIAHPVRFDDREWMRKNSPPN